MTKLVRDAGARAQFFAFVATLARKGQNIMHYVYILVEANSCQLK